MNLAQVREQAAESKKELVDSIDVSKVLTKKEIEEIEVSSSEEDKDSSEEEDKLVLKKADSIVKAKREMESKAKELSDSDSDDLQQIIIKKKEKPVSVPDEVKADTIVVV